MITILFSFPNHAARHTELRTKYNGAGFSVTEELPKPHHASRHVHQCSLGAQTGNPVTAMLAVSPPLRQTRLWTVHGFAGDPVTTKQAFSAPLLREYLRLDWTVAGNAVTVPLAFSMPLKQTSLQSAYEHAGKPVTESIAFYRLPIQHASLKWESGRKSYATAMVRFRNDYNNYLTETVAYRYDWKTIYGTVFRYRHRSLVQGGWRIMAKNLETEEIFELGFINADGPARSLENICLPDGDYEISVLTSSLFWKDSMDGNVRTISVRPGEEVSPLPVIHNLRSAVADGATTVYWSASKSEIEECLFGIWYSSESPVDTNRTPDATVWYSNTMTEYQTSFAQNAPAWVAVAAMRIVEETKIGKVHQLYLDWSNVPPRAPDDVMILPEPLPTFDDEVLERPVEDVDLALVF